VTGFVYVYCAALQIAGVGVVYFINMIVESVYINQKIRAYEGNLDFVGQAALKKDDDDDD